MPNYNRWVIRQAPIIRTTLATEVSIAASVTSEEVLAANDDRLYALFVNISDTTMYLRLGEDAVVSEGIPLAASVGNYEINATNLYQGAVNVAASAATKIILITEGT